MEYPEKEGQTAGVSPFLSLHFFLFLLTASWNMDIMAGALAAFKDLRDNLDREAIHSQNRKIEKARVPWSYHGKPLNLISELYRREKIPVYRSHGN